MKISIALLKKMVTELESCSTEIASLEDQSRDSEELNHQYLIAMCKAAGLCMGVSQEAAALIGDLQKIVGASYYKPAAGDHTGSPLDALLGSYLSPSKIKN